MATRSRPIRCGRLARMPPLVVTCPPSYHLKVTYSTWLCDVRRVAVKPNRFDALVKRRGGRWSRRTALGAASVAALAGLTPLRLGRTGTAQDASTPAASPAASPGATPVATPAASPGP